MVKSFQPALQPNSFIPILSGGYIPHPTCKNTFTARELAHCNRHMRIAERLSEHTRHLPPLKVGDHVPIQNQIGPYPRKWDKTGLVIEVRQIDQYVIRVDGSGRVIIRNRQFLRKFTPVQQRLPRHNINEDIRTYQRPRTKPPNPQHLQLMRPILHHLPALPAQWTYAHQILQTCHNLFADL